METGSRRLKILEKGKEIGFFFSWDNMKEWKKNTLRHEIVKVSGRETEHHCLFVPPLFSKIIWSSLPKLKKKKDRVIMKLVNREN